VPKLAEPFDDLSLDVLRQRKSAKWTGYAADVLPAWVAEMDFPLAEPIARVLHAAIDACDLGYANPVEYGQAFANFCAAEFGWTFGPKDVLAVADVMTGVRELVQVLAKPGDRLVINSPVYPPFFDVAKGAGLVTVDVPLHHERTDQADVWSLDLEAIERAYAEGATLHLLCSPHNPTGTVHARDTLTALAALAAKYGVTILSDEIHAPLTHPGAVHVPMAAVSEDGARHAIVLTSASKTWNLPGLKAAAIIATSDLTRAMVRKLPVETPWHSGHLGILAAQVALRDGAPWRARALATIDRNRLLLPELLASALAGVRYTPPQAGYLAWLDCTALGLGDDPARVFLKKGRVALSNGPMFGAPGKGYARLNLATSRTLLEEAVARMAASVG
jgi:cystathionine beta-lyase